MKSQNRTIEPFGMITFYNTSNDSHWFGNVKNISDVNDVELTINVENIEQDLTLKIDLIKSFANDYFEIMTTIFNYIDSKFEEKSLNEIEDMYFLTAVTLHNDNMTWWVVLEAAPEVVGIYDYFLRFTIKDKIIIWANF